MNLFSDDKVKEYLSSLGETKAIQLVRTICQCHTTNALVKIHDETATAHSDNMVQLATSQEGAPLRTLVMYITEKSYFSGDSMRHLIVKMFDSKDMAGVLMYSNVLNTNFGMHPPCARYMSDEYYKLLLVPFDGHFRDMTLWRYLIHRLNDIVDRSYPYGRDKVSDMAFKRTLTFCVNLLQMDAEVYSQTNVKPLIIKCLNINVDHEHRMVFMKKILDMAFVEGQDLQVPIINLAVLLRRFS